MVFLVVEPSPSFLNRSLAADCPLVHLHHFHTFTLTVSSYIVVENDRSFYEEPYPSDFGKNFRVIRNSLSHADFRRIDGIDERINLTEFYKKYHKIRKSFYITMDLNGGALIN